MAHKRKILTVLLLSAGCGTTAAPSKQTAASEVPVPAVAGTTTTAAVPVAAGEPAMVPMTPAPAKTAPTPLPDEVQPEALIELRAALYGGGREAALASTTRFRALCDADGFPLVGNIANKGAMYRVSAYCEDVRTTLVKAKS